MPLSPEPTQEIGCEYPELNRLLASATNLKSLHVRALRCRNPLTRCEASFNFDFQPDRHWFPALEHLTLGFETMELTPMVYQLWNTYTDWGHLRTLNLGGGGPKHFISALTGLVLKLKKLEAGYIGDNSEGDGLD